MNDRPMDVSKCKLMPRIWHKTPYLQCALEFSNSTNINKHVFPSSAKIEIFGELVAYTIPTFVSPGSVRGVPWGGTCEGSKIGVIDSDWKAGTKRFLYCCFEIGAMALNSLADAFQTKGNGSYRVEVELDTIEEQSMMVRRSPNGPITEEPVPRLHKGILVYVEGQINIHDWHTWTQTWGVASEAIYLPKELANRLRAIKPVMAVGVEWEVITELLKSYQGLKAESILTTSEDELETKMAEVIVNAEKQLMILCRALDEMLVPQMIATRDKGVDVRIVMVPTDKLRDEKYPQLARIEQALKKVCPRIKVRMNVQQHARMVVSEKAVLVGSTDPDYFGLKIHKNASVYTTDATVVYAAQLFFDKLWQESEVQ